LTPATLEDSAVPTQNSYRLVTNILDPEKAPCLELAALYHERWVVGDNYLVRSTTTILAGFAPVPGRSGRRVYREPIVIQRRFALCPARRSRTTKCNSTSNTT
jgi:hypothetical protein